MASIELPLPNDPADYEPKAVAGKLSYRALATILAIAVAEVPLMLRLISLGMERLPDTNLVFVVAAVPAALIGLIGLSRREGLYFEQWFPVLLSELTCPQTLLPCEARPTEGTQKGPARAERRAARAEQDLLARESAALVALARAGHPVRGLAAGEGRGRARLAALAPELLVRTPLTRSGITARQARRLKRRGIDLVWRGDAEELRGRRVGRTLARKAALAAEELARCAELMDCCCADEVAHVLEAWGVREPAGKFELVQPSE